MAALSEIEKLEARWAENPDGRYFAPLADAYRKAGRIDEAITVATGGLGKHPDYLSAHIVLGRCYLAKKDDGEARAAFERVLALDGENIIALKSLAEIAERENQIDDARRWLQRLLTIDAMNAEAAEDLARLGGPIDQEAPAAAPAEEPAGERISFADLAPEPIAVEEPTPPPAPEKAAARRSESTEQVPAIDYIPGIPRTLERPAVSADQARMAQDRTLGMDAVPSAAPAEAEAAPPLELESVAFTPPAPEETSAAQPSDLVPFDDQLQWGAGERQSQAIHAEDIAKAEASHEATANAIDFIGGAPPATHHDEPMPEPEPAPEPVMEEPAPEPAPAQEGIQGEPEPMALDVESQAPAAAWESQHRASAAYDAPNLEAEAPQVEEPARESSSSDLHLI
ncbi:MAG TPA: tetratricopeptide repeat protein, partial [Gemmatimonadales bacterium]